MAHFAQLDSDNTIINLIVVNNKDILDKNGSESELVGISFCKELFGVETNWVQSSYNNNFRKQLAEIGGTYNSTADVFIGPPLYPSWSLDTNNDWQAPIPMPEDGAYYRWDEDIMGWIKTGEGVSRPKIENINGTV